MPECPVSDSFGVTFGTPASREDDLFDVNVRSNIIRYPRPSGRQTVVTVRVPFRKQLLVMPARKYTFTVVEQKKPSVDDSEVLRN